MLTIQVDASINSGNSGGAAINDKGNVVGIVMQSYSKSQSDNIGYIIPSVIVNTFIEDIRDSKIDGFDNSKTYTQKFENQDLKDYYHIKNDKGVLIVGLEKYEYILKLGDLLLEIDNKEVLNDGTVQTQYGFQNFKYLFHTKPVGETISVKVQRDGKIINFQYKLKEKYELVQKERFKEPRYLIFGGLVFSPLTENYLQEHNLDTKLFDVFYELKNEAKDIKEGVILQTEKFSHNVNEGYNPFIYLVHSVNGTKVKDFNHFVKLIDESKEKYTVIDFLDSDFTKYVFDTKKAKESFVEIKNIYGLTIDRRVE